MDMALLDVWSSINYCFYCRHCAFTDDNCYNAEFALARYVMFVIH